MCKTLVAISMLAIGAAYAYDDCSCVCGNGQNSRVVSDGRQMNAQPTADGYFFRDGRVMVYRNGNPTELTQETVFEDGSRLSVDGTLILRDGTRRRFRDNQYVTLDGRILDRERMNASYREQNTRDGYFMRNGKVMSFRNGNMTELTTETTLDNGTRIMADGTVIMKDGTRSRIGEKQWMSHDGRTNESTNHENNAARDASHNRVDQTNEQHHSDVNVNRNNVNGNANVNAQEAHRENTNDVKRNSELRNEQAGRNENKHDAPKNDAAPRSETKREQTGRAESKPETNKNDANSNAGRSENKQEEKK